MFPHNTPEMMDTALIVFAKWPVPGQVKTRLTAQVSPRQAAQLYTAFLRDALEQYTALPADVRLYMAGAPADDAILTTPPASVACFEQVGASLGARMQAAFTATFASGYQRAAIIGTDHPTLPAVFVRRALDALAPRNAISIGPSTDGGYYLLGMSRLYPELFRDMQYSHGRVFTETLERAARTDAHLTILPEWYDVDEPDDLRRLVADLRHRREGAAAHTQAVIRQLGLESVDAV